jgi:phospholipase/carboxylesterase
MQPISTSLHHRLILPSGNSGVHPALILVHGRGADEEDLLGLAPYLDKRFLLLSVRAPFPFSYGGGYTWYEMGDIGTPEADSFRTSYDKLNEFIHDALKAYPIDHHRVYLLGFSMGTVMSYALSLSRPELIRGVVANSGYMPEGIDVALHWDQADRLKFFVAHGRFDPVIPIQLGRRAHEMLQATRAHVIYKEYPMAHQISEESLRDGATWLTTSLTDDGI